MRATLLLGAAAMALVACDGDPAPIQRGTSPNLPEPQRGLLPNMTVPRPAGWGSEMPTVPQGYTIQAIATDLRIPRQMLALPNGDILVAEGAGGNAPRLRPKDFIAGVIKSWGKTSVSGGDRLTLLRDADGDGTYETRGIFASNLNAPYGLALANGSIYVANQDALVRFDYAEGQTEAEGPPTLVAALPAAINHHWTKALTVSADGRFLYVGIGSNSNITERGMTAEANRAEVWQINAETGAHRPYATGLRNPTALAIQPDSGQLYAVVNERDEIGPNLVPDYLTSVQDGGFYGWPYSYWGQNVDNRVQPQAPDLVAAAIEPDYALGAHVAALGLTFSTPAMGADFATGVFVGLHGSWNRSVPSGYQVIFVPFEGGRPAGEAVDFVTGFLNAEGNARGRPVGVIIDARGGLVIADDLTNTIWRVTANAPQQAAAPATAPLVLVTPTAPNPAPNPAAGPAASPVAGPAAGPAASTATATEAIITTVPVAEPATTPSR